LRVEDTDRERLTAEAVAAIYDGLRYLGLHWDEGPEAGGDHGPYLQSERVDRHRTYAERLLAEGKAYRSFSAQKRSEEERQRDPHGRDRVALSQQDRGMDPEEARRRTEAGEPSVLRFRVPEGATVVDDLVRGKVTFQNTEIDDFILQRSDGTCVYNFVVACDDHDMAISHVIRGEDHLSNTPKQVLLFEAFGWSVPAYGHIPLILGPGGGKLSKRHGAVSVMEYASAGYLPEAMINFLVRLGWSFDDKQEIFGLEELCEKFSLDGVSKSGAVYDLKKLQHLGGHYLRERSIDDVVEMAQPYLVEAGFVAAGDPASEGSRLRAMVALEKDRMDHVGQIAEKVRYYFHDPETVDKGARKALRKKKDMAPAVLRYAESLEREVSADDWTVDAATVLEGHAKRFLEAEGVGLGDLAQPVRAVVTGRGATPGLFEVLAALGKETVLRRLRGADAVFQLALSDTDGA